MSESLRLRRALRRQWWVVPACMVTGVIGLFGYVHTRPTVYTSNAIVLVVAPTTTIQLSQAVVESGPVTVSPLGVGAAATSLVLEQPAVRAAAASGGAGAQVSAVMSTSGQTVTITVSAPRAGQAQSVASKVAAAYAAWQKKAYLRQADQYRNSVGGWASEVDALTKAQVNPTDGETPISIDALLFVYDEEFSYRSAAARVSVSSPATVGALSTVSVGGHDLRYALLGSLLAGVGAALALARMDDRLFSVTEVAGPGARVLAELPAGDDDPSTIAEDPGGSMAEAIRRLRTTLQFLHHDGQPRTLVVTSAGAGEGRSLVAANLAVAFALDGVRTILVSSDLREPSVETTLGLEEYTSYGLSEAIVSTGHRPADRLDEILVPTDIPGLELLPAGSSPPNPAELLGLPGTRQLVAALRERAELIIFDSPPLLAATDGLILATLADGALFVTALKHASRQEVTRALEALRATGTELLGVVVNPAPR